MPRAGQYWRHYKGKLYYIISIAKHTETEEEMVVYRDTTYNDKVWCRPMSMWKDKVIDSEGKVVDRFTHLPQIDI